MCFVLFLKRGNSTLQNLKMESRRIMVSLLAQMNDQSRT